MLTAIPPNKRTKLETPHVRVFPELVEKAVGLLLTIVEERPRVGVPPRLVGTAGGGIPGVFVVK